MSLPEYRPEPVGALNTVLLQPATSLQRRICHLLSCKIPGLLLSPDRSTLAVPYPLLLWVLLETVALRDRATSDSFYWEVSQLVDTLTVYKDFLRS